MGIYGHMRPTVSILQGDAFVVCDETGDFSSASPGPLGGMFFRDVRHLSVWQLRVNGRALDVLSADAWEYDEAQFFLVEATGTVYHNPSLSAARRRQVASGLQESLEVRNHSTDAVVLEVSVLFDADFADIFEVKNRLMKSGQRYRYRHEDTVTLGYLRGDFRRETYVRAPGAFFTDTSLTYRVELAPREVWSTQLEVTVGIGPDRPMPQLLHSPHMPISLPEWLDSAPRLETDWDDLGHTYRRSLVDLAALRFYPESTASTSLPAAGLPWFMALFGRDSLITSYQAMPFAPELAHTTLHALAERQATEWDDFRDAEPGKILHELRHGELVYFDEAPQSPYYGAADTTPLFLIVLDEYERWTGDTETVRELEGAARAALGWIAECGAQNDAGYLAYQTRNPESGLANQCWKDSRDSIVHPDGSLATLPRATCEIQGYAYDARRRTARLAREVWHDQALAVRLETEADELQRRFDADFWLPERDWYALALDGDLQPVRTLTSNIGHLLWSGIVPPERLDAVAGHLCGDPLFSGWGVRTLAEGQAAYNPLAYHDGTVWPHDTSIAAAGLARYGRRDAANKLAVALLDAAVHFQFRLPEAFAGHPRMVTRVPVQYPTACSPQAWATGAPLLLLRVFLGLEPGKDRLLTAPYLPDAIQRLAIRRIPGRWGTGDAVATR